MSYFLTHGKGLCLSTFFTDCKDSIYKRARILRGRRLCAKDEPNGHRAFFSVPTVNGGCHEYLY
jgi:hypothetical protein